jgi:hypothetical protein
VTGLVLVGVFAALGFAVFADLRARLGDERRVLGAGAGERDTLGMHVRSQIAVVGSRSARANSAARKFTSAVYDRARASWAVHNDAVGGAAKFVEGGATELPPSGDTETLSTLGRLLRAYARDP